MRILVTGGAGYIGSHAVRLFLERGHDVWVYDSLALGHRQHVDDLAEAHLLALDGLHPGRGMHYNLGIGRGYSVREVIRAVEEVTGKKVPIKEGPRRAGDPPVLVASSDKIQKELGWKPRATELRPIVETAWNWHSKNPKGYRK